MLTFLLLLLLAAVMFDFYKYKIPNILILCGIIERIIYFIYHDNLQSIISHIPGILFPLFLLFPLYKIGTLGAGDLKLFSLLGFYFSFMETAFCLWNAFLVGAVISFILLLWRKNLKERILYFISFLKECFKTGGFRYYYQETEEEKYKNEKSKIHFSLPIFLSVLFYISI